MEERHLSYRQLAYKTKLSAGYLNHLTKGTRPGAGRSGDRRDRRGPLRRA